MKYIQNFALHLKVERDLSKNTVLAYTKDLENFNSFISCEIEDVDPTVVLSYVSHLTDQGMKRTTITRALTSIKVFYKYLCDVERVISSSPAKEVKLKSREKSLPKALSKSDTMKLLATASKDGMKSRLIIELLYGLGGRVTEIASLRIEDVDMEENYVRIVGKGNKERHNPIHESCVDLLKRYVRDYGITSGYLFPHRFDNSRHLTREAIYLKVTDLATKAGVDNVSPHVFRHSYATHLIDNGCDMAIVQEFLGHEDIATTKIYAKVSRGNKASNFKNFHPLA